MEKPKETKVVSIIEAEEAKRKKSWNDMTPEQQEAYMEEKRKVDETYNEYADNLNRRYKDPVRYVNRKQNPKQKFGHNIFKKLKK